MFFEKFHCTLANCLGYNSCRGTQLEKSFKIYLKSRAVVLNLFSFVAQKFCGPINILCKQKNTK